MTSVEAAALTEQVAEAVRQIINDYALDNETLHASWRCQHPDIYGPCSCVAEFVDNATDTIRARLADSRPAVSEAATREQLAKAWDEGRSAVSTFVLSEYDAMVATDPMPEPPVNAHRLSPTGDDSE